MWSPIPPPAPLFGEAPTPGSSPATPSTTEIEIQLSLSRLVVAIETWERSMRVPLPTRLARGVTRHFALRVAEWFTAATLTGFGWTLLGPTEVFAHSPAFSGLAAAFSEETWGIACVAIGGLHLAALGINGTFPAFRFSPHVRLATSVLACFAWAHIALGFYRSGVVTTGLRTYGLILLLEIFNVARAGIDVGAVEGRRAARGC